MAKRSKRRAQPAMTGPTEKPVPTPGKSSDRGTATPDAPKAPPSQVGDRPGRPRRTAARKQEAVFTWPFGKRNLYFLLAALATIVAGYIALGIGPYDSFASVTLGPILLVIGYLVMLPLAILVREKKPAGE